MTELNFDRYQILRLAEMPKVETVIVPTLDFWGGVGEPTICVVTPAVLNAIFAATGKPVRSLPLKNVKRVECNNGTGAWPSRCVPGCNPGTTRGSCSFPAG